MDQLIPVINKLQDVFNSVGSDATLELSLPQIAVVGAQSSGKSSVLEHLVGRDFLPRGSGIVTRRPLVLQMVNIPRRPRTASDGGTGGDLEWGEFLHIRGRKFYDFTEIRDQIERDTEQATGGPSSKKISPHPIHLKIYSPNVLNLTLVDLPGITKVPVHDQPEDIEQQIHELIMQYCQQPNCIILAVTAANTDIANSDALKYARKVDPQGLRTIGVCTKLDLMDAGTDAMDVLRGKVVNLKLGFIGVVNRSQKDILDNVPISVALEREQEFFRSHPAYRPFAVQMGTQYLARTLNRILVHHIHECLPELRGRVAALLSQTQQKMQALGEFDAEHIDKGALVLQLLTKFSTQYCSIIDGTSGMLATEELTGGARICYIFHETFGSAVGTMDPLEGLTDMDIRTAIRNASGTRRALFVPEVSFEMLVKRQIERLRPLSHSCVDLVHEELQRLVLRCASQELTRFNGLWQAVHECVVELLHERLPPAQRMVDDIIMMELAHINTAHPDFVGGGRAVEQLLMDQREQLDKDSVSISPVPMAQPMVEPLRPSIDDYAGDFGVFSPMAGDPGLEMYNVPDTHAPDRPSGLFGRWFRRGSAAQPMAQPGTSPPEAYAPDMDEPISMQPVSDRDRMETELIRSLIRSYFGVVAKNVQDKVPKAVMYSLVCHVKDNLHARLVSRLYKHDMFMAMLQENPEIARERRETKEQLEALERALRILKEIRETTVR